MVQQVLLNTATSAKQSLCKKVGGAGSNVSSSKSDVTTTTITVITTQPASVASCIGTSASLSVTATGSNLTYQWYKAGTAITGATNSILNISNLQTSDANTYNVIATGACGSATSSNATVTVGTPTVLQFSQFLAL
jgi:hypothetical protein